MIRLWAIVAVATLLGGGAALAQAGFPGMSASDTSAAPSFDGIGVPSPVGATSTLAPVGGAGIPLGTTELFAGGLSPAPADSACPAAGSNPGVGALGTGSIFSGAGTMATSTSDLASSGDATDSGCGAVPSAGAGLLGLTSTLGAAPAFAGGNIPLGATALGAAGLAGTIAVPGSSSPCLGPGSLGMAGPGPATAGSIPLPGMTPNSC